MQKNTGLPYDESIISSIVLSINHFKYKHHILIPSTGIAIYLFLKNPTWIKALIQTTGFGLSYILTSFKWITKSVYGKQYTLSKIPTSSITKLFQDCLDAPGATQRLLSNQFYTKINEWTSDQLQIDGRCVVVNFLFWYYYRTQYHDSKFTAKKADHIRHWADYTTQCDLKWVYYNRKFDYMYSVAFQQRSISHLKKFYQWINNTEFRSIPKNATSEKPHYYLTKYQVACILGDWNKAKTLGHIIKDNLTTKKDCLMDYTLRAVERPSDQPNFAVMFRIADKVVHEFASSILPAPIFTVWHIFSFKYRNIHGNSSFLIDKKFIASSHDSKDDNGYYMFRPRRPRQRLQLNIWGRVCQMISPDGDVTGYLPWTVLTGSWSDTKLYMERNWTYLADIITQKHVIMRVERVPLEDDVETKDNFGNIKSDKGYIWRGTITVHMRTFEKGLTIHDLNNHGEFYFDGERGMKLSCDVVNRKQHNETHNIKETGMKWENPIQETQIYEVELIINKRSCLN